MASPKSLRGEKKMNPALFVDSIEEEKIPRRFVRMCSFGDDFYSSFFCAKSVPFISKLKTTFSFETNRIQTDDDETTTNAVSIDKMSENVTLSSSSAMLSNENDGDVVIQDDLTEMLTLVPEDVREKSLHLHPK